MGHLVPGQPHSLSSLLTPHSQTHVVTDAWRGHGVCPRSHREQWQGCYCTYVMGSPVPGFSHKNVAVPYPGCLGKGRSVLFKSCYESHALEACFGRHMAGAVCCSPSKGHTSPALSLALQLCPSCALAQLSILRRAKSCRILLGALCHSVLLTTAHLPWQSDPHCSNL